MKKKILLFALIATMAFSAIGVSAASAGDGAYAGNSSVVAVAETAEAVELEYYKPVGNAYTIEYEVGEDYNGQWFGLLATEGVFTDEIGEIAYIDQAQAADGKVTFAGFTPMVEPGEEKFAESTVYIGSDGFNNNVKKAIGILTDGTGANITGKAVGVDSVMVMNGEKIVRNVAIAKDGSFDVPVPAGKGYSVVYSKASYLDYAYTNIDMGSANIALNDVDMEAIEGLKGDFNADGQKTIEDLADLIAVYNSNNGTYDITADGAVNMYDITEFLKEYGKCAVEKEYVAIAQ